MSDGCSTDPAWVAARSIDCNGAAVCDAATTTVAHMDRPLNIPMVHGSAVAAGSAHCDGTAAESRAVESQIAMPDGASMMCCHGCCGHHFRCRDWSKWYARDLDVCCRQV